VARWSRQEIEEAFAHYQDVARRCANSHDWNEWADLFTEDATYVEHLYGTFGGREAIRNWITSAMEPEPVNEMIWFPVEWYMIDEERGWVSCHIWNRMADPGDGSIHQSPNFSLLKYAGNNLWSYEEDIYNPSHFAEMIRGWLDRKRELSRAPDESGGHRSQD
jgi:hypothetical protein